MFMRTVATFTGTTFPAVGATTIYVAVLVPSTVYSITGAGTPGTATTDTAGGVEFCCDGNGEYHSWGRIAAIGRGYDQRQCRTIGKRRYSIVGPSKVEESNSVA